MPWLEDPVAAAMALPPLAVVGFVFLSAWLKYVFPPIWGDSLVLLGFFLAGRGAAPPTAVFAAAFAGSVLGSAAAYAIGRRYGMDILQRVMATGPRERALALFRQHGERLLLVNRFLWFVRGFMLYAAGAARLRFRESMFYCSISNLAFVGLLMWVGLWSADSWTGIQDAFARYNVAVGTAVLVVIGLWVALRASTAVRASFVGKD